MPTKTTTKKKTTAKKTTTKKRSPKRPKKYGALASKKVERSMDEMKHGKLKSGRSGKKVTNPKQAIAIGLSEARREGGKVPKRRTSKARKAK